MDIKYDYSEVVDCDMFFVAVCNQSGIDITFFYKLKVNPEDLISVAEFWPGHVARMEEGRSAFKILTGKPTGKRPLGRPKRRWEDNIRMYHEEIGINERIGLIGLRKGIIVEPLWMRH